MKKEYLQLTIEELVEERGFINWMLHGKNQEEWDLFLSENPEFKAKTEKAQEIIELLRDRQEHLSKEDILKIWKNIDRFDDRIRKQLHRIKIYRYMRYAAVLTIVLVVSATGYFTIKQNHKPYVFTSGTDMETSEQSRLLLYDGTTINLEKKNSTVALNAREQIIIDNKDLIDLSKKDRNDGSKMNEVVIPYGKKSQLTLEDGTRVWLNAGSRMAFPTKFKGKTREVFLEGESYFEVAPNKDLPFIVNTNDISVKVLGTKFNISAYHSDQLIETVLIEGKVSVNERTALGFPGEGRILAPNQNASFDKAQKRLTVKDEPDVEFVIAWTEGWFKFSHQSLYDVLKKLRRYYNVEFHVEPGFPTGDRITGKLDLKDSLGQVMLALSDVAGLQFRIDGNKIYINKSR